MLKKVRKIIGNVYVFSVFSRVLMVAVGFLYSVLLARYLGSELKGQLAHINTITAITTIIFTFGMHQAYPYYKKQQHEGIEAVYPRVCLMAFAGYSVLSLAVSVCIPGLEERYRFAVLLTPLLTFTKMVTYQAMVENPNRKHVWEIVCELAEVAVLAVLLLWVPRSLHYAIAVIVGKNLMACVYYLRMARVNLRFSREDVVMLRRFAAFGFLPMLALLMNNLNYRVDVLMLANAVEDAQIGVYSVGIQIAEKVWLVSDALRDVLFSKLIRGKDAEEVNKVMRICFTISLAVILLIIVLGRPFIRIFYGEEYAGAYEPLVIVLFGTLLMVYYKVIQAYNIVHKKQRINFIFLGISVIANVIMNFILIPEYGINGAAAASLISYSLCAVLFVREYLRATHSGLREIIFINRSDFQIVRNALKK